MNELRQASGGWKSFSTATLFIQACWHERGAKVQLKLRMDDMEFYASFSPDNSTLFV